MDQKFNFWGGIYEKNNKKYWVFDDRQSVDKAALCFVQLAYVSETNREKRQILGDRNRTFVMA
jgi:hypothetical protein